MVPLKITRDGKETIQGVLDIDSAQFNSFDEIDKEYLQQIAEMGKQTCFVTHSSLSRLRLEFIELQMIIRNKLRYKYNLLIDFRRFYTISFCFNKTFLFVGLNFSFSL